ncbi:DUF2169 family type VI secretion system accessory protein [Variovorax atrisoli]|uniref:DUF2169 family type VI secretion system accessory protein n=1 Tax=Variovorax atrisoli TaxID=3394203 RepID=UPI00339A35CD
MEVVNSTGMTVGYTQGVEPSGRELLVVVVKGTFAIPESTLGSDSALQMHAVQRPLIVADTFTGEPGYSAPAEEVDFAPRKHRCDVLVSGSAYAPHGEPAERVLVGVRIGNWRKAFAVTGDRQWLCGLSGAHASTPELFATKRISYDVAFGGVDARHEDPDQHGAYMRNPVGRGWHRHLQARYLDGAPLPNTEEIDRPVAAPDGTFPPMAFGPLGRGWAERLPHAGTYDQSWIDHTFPFLPADFNEAYYQAAPADQQIGFPLGDEEVVLMNLRPEGQTRFRLPCREVPVTFFRRKGGREEIDATLDTIAIDADQGFVTLAWRATLPLKKSIFEISNILAGRMSTGWWRARELGKEWHPSLANLVSTRRAAAEEEV